MAGSVVAKNMIVRIGIFHILCQFRPWAIGVFRFTTNHPYDRVCTVAGNDVPPMSFESFKSHLDKSAFTTTLRTPPAANHYRNNAVIDEMFDTSVGIFKVGRVHYAKINCFVG